MYILDPLCILKWWIKKYLKEFQICALTLFELKMYATLEKEQFKEIIGSSKLPSHSCP